MAEIGTIATGNTPKTDVKAFYSESGTPWITPSDIKDGKVYKPSRYLSPEGIKTARLMPAGSILVTCIASIGKNTLLTEESAFNQQINGLTPSKLSDSYFLFTDSSQWSEKMKRIAAAQTMQIINKSEFSHLETMIPSFPEQQMVGKFFYNVDNLITLHQRYRAPPSSFCVKLSVYVLYPQTRQLVRVLVYESIFTVISDRLIS